MKFLKFFTVLTLFCTSSWAAPAIPAANDGPRMLLHLLGYIGQDYSGAVQGGKVLSAQEYSEMTEFGRTVWETANATEGLRTNPQLLAELEKLRTLIARKAEAREVAVVAESAGKRVLRLTGLAVAPAHWPNRVHAKALYERQCAQCHGTTGHGDGPASPNQNPRPFDFHSAKAEGISPFQSFNAIRLGVPGTTMVPFTALSEEETWELAFYVLSLRFEGQTALVAGGDSTLSLEEAATQSDTQLLKVLPGSPQQKAAALTAVRLRSSEGKTLTKSLSLAVLEIQQAFSYAQQGRWDLGQSAAVKAYLEGVEPAEAELRLRDPGFTADLEQKMGEVRSALQEKLPLADLQSKVDVALKTLKSAEGLLARQISSPAFTFSVAAGIFLREAFEAVLIIITLLGVIRSVGSRSALVAVHAGWMLAIGFGVLTWFFSGWLIAISGAQREILEAATSLIAVSVLLYFGFWLHQKSEIGKWRAFINEKIKTALEGKKLVALGMVSFMAVFREAFETVIFLRALLLEAGTQQQLAVAAGVIVSFVLVVVLAAALIRFSIRIPLRQLFALSSLVMVLLALILAGKAAHSFQETGWLPVTTLPLSFHFDLIGLYATWETLIPQLLILAVSCGYWLWTRRSVSV